MSRLSRDVYVLVEYKKDECKVVQVYANNDRAALAALRHKNKNPDVTSVHILTKKLQGGKVVKNRKEKVLV